VPTPFVALASVYAIPKARVNVVTYQWSETRKDRTREHTSRDEATRSGTHTAFAARVSRTVDATADHPVCGLNLYKHDHLLCVKGQPHCPTCYSGTLGPGAGPKPTTEPTAPVTLGRSHVGRPAPPARRRFAPPGLVIRPSQPSKLSDSFSHSSKPPLVSTTTPAAHPSPAPLQDHRHLNKIDVGSSHPVKPKIDEGKGQLKGPQGLYRDTVRNLAKRFESPVSPTPDQEGTNTRRMFHW
jgi:hypothetical protein